MSCHASARSASSSNVAIARSASGAQLVAARGAEHVREMTEPDLGAELGDLVADLAGEADRLAEHILRFRERTRVLHRPGQIREQHRAFRRGVTEQRVRPAEK